MRPLAQTLRAAGAAALLGAASAASALNLSYGDVAVRNLDSWGFTATNSELMTDWNGSSGTDQLYQMFGYVGTASGMVAVNASSFRTGCGTGTAATLCGSAIAQTGVNTASSRIVLNQNVGNGATRLARNALSLTYDFTLVDDTSPADLDRLHWDVTFTNNTASSMSFVFYSYLDLDLLGTQNNDLVTVQNNGQQIVVRDATNPSGRPYVWNALNGTAAHYQVSAYPGLSNQLATWTSAQNLNDTNAMATVQGDVTAAFQYFITLGAGQSLSLTSTVAEPSTAAMLALGLGGLALYARPRKRARARAARG